MREGVAGEKYQLEVSGAGGVGKARSAMRGGEKSNGGGRKGGEAEKEGGEEGLKGLGTCGGGMRRGTGW